MKNKYKKKHFGDFSRNSMKTLSFPFFKDGRCVYYHVSGNIRNESYWANGARIRTRTEYYDNGVKKWEFDYEKLRRTNWWSDGKIQSINPFNNSYGQSVSGTTYTRNGEKQEHCYLYGTKFSSIYN